MSNCQHDPFVAAPTIVIESHPWAGVRLRCQECGSTADVGNKSGRIRPVSCNCPSGRTTAHLPECPTLETRIDEVQR